MREVRHNQDICHPLQKKYFELFTGKLNLQNIFLSRMSIWPKHVYMRMSLFVAFTFLSLTTKAQKNFCDYDRFKSPTFPSPQISGKTETDTSTLLTVPVVVHILHLKDPIGSSNNPGDEVIKETIKYLSKTFRCQWPGYADTLNGGVDLKIEFVLATKDDAGKPSNGIDRIDATKFPAYTQNGDLFPDSVLQKTMWNRMKYFNIWLVYKTGYRTGFGSPIQPPTAPVFNFEGVVLNVFVFKPGDPVIVHETGHYLGLDHTWGGAFGNNCPSNSNCQTQGDLICDTEPHLESASCNLIGTINPCTGLPFGNTLKNFMSYSDLSCWDRFTKEQRIHMRDLLLSLRPGIPGNTATIVTPVALKEFNDFMITPNPSFGTFRIKLTVPFKDPVNLSVINTMGQSVYNTILSDQTIIVHTITLNNLSSGFYFLVLRDRSGTVSRKIFIR